MRSTTGMNCIQVGADLVAQEAVDFQRIVGVDAVDGGQDVVLDAMLLQQAQAAHHLVEGGRAALVHAVDVVQFARAIDADADEEVVFLVRTRTIRRPAACRWSAWCARSVMPGRRYFSTSSMTRR